MERVTDWPRDFVPATRAVVWRGTEPERQFGRHWQPPSTAYTVYDATHRRRILLRSRIREGADSWTAPGSSFGPRKWEARFRCSSSTRKTWGAWPAQDVVTDIPPIGARAAERGAGDTQRRSLRPVCDGSLRASSNPGRCRTRPLLRMRHDGRGRRNSSLVSGSGSTYHRQRWRSCDVVCGIRTEPFRPSSTRPTPRRALRQLKPFEFQNCVVNACRATRRAKKCGDMGIDGWWFFGTDADPGQAVGRRRP